MFLPAVTDFLYFLPPASPDRKCNRFARDDGSKKMGTPLPYGFPYIPNAGLSSLPRLYNFNNALCLGLLSHKQTSYDHVCWCDK